MTNTDSLPLDRLLNLKDKFGNDIYLSDTEARMPAFPTVPDFSQQLINIRNVELRSDDIIVVGYPKTGNNWTHHMVSMLQAGTVDMPNMFSDGNYSFLEAYNDDGSRLASLDNPRVLFSHLPLRFLPRDVLEKKVKIVMLTRNPKDVFVSHFNHVKRQALPKGYNGSWAQYFAVMLEQGLCYGQLFDYWKNWQTEIEAHPDLPVFHCNYEDTKRDTLGQVENLNQWLGTGRSKEFCQAIVDACQLGNMVKIRSFSDDAKPAWRLKEGRCEGDFYRKGIVGDWKNWFTVAQNEEFDAAYAAKMADFKIKLDFE